MGPGSFTALRASAALVMGIATRGNRAKTPPVLARGVPSIAAMGVEAAKLAPDAKTAAILYDAKKGGVLRCALEARAEGMAPKSGTGLASRVSSVEELKEFDVVLALSADRAALEDKIPTLDGVFWLDSFPVANLLGLPEYPWGEGLDDPLYLRPATDAKPTFSASPN